MYRFICKLHLLKKKEQIHVALDFFLLAQIQINGYRILIFKKFPGFHLWLTYLRNRISFHYISQTDYGIFLEKQFENQSCWVFFPPHLDKMPITPQTCCAILSVWFFFQKKVEGAMVLWPFLGLAGTGGETLGTFQVNFHMITWIPCSQI